MYLIVNLIWFNYFMNLSKKIVNLFRVVHAIVIIY